MCKQFGIFSRLSTLKGYKFHTRQIFFSTECSERVCLTFHYALYIMQQVAHTARLTLHAGWNHLRQGGHEDSSKQEA